MPRSDGCALEQEVSSLVLIGSGSTRSLIVYSISERR